MRRKIVGCCLAGLVVMSMSGVASAQRRPITKSPRSRADAARERLKIEAEQAYRRGAHQRVVDLTTRVLEENPRDPVAYYLRASSSCEIGIGSRDKSWLRQGVADAREAIRFDNGRNKLYYIPYIYGMTNLAVIEDRPKHAETAVEIADQVLAAKSITKEEQAHIRYQRAGALVILKRTDEAVADYDRAIEADRKLIVAYLGRANALASTGKTDKTLESYAALIGAFPDNPTAYDARGVYLQQLGRLDEALVDFSKAIELNPQYTSGYANRGFVLMATDNAEGAEVDFDNALRLAPGYPLYHKLRSSARLAQGKADAAVEDLRAAVKAQPNDPTTHAELGFALFFAGDLRGAVQSFDEAQKLAPEMKHVDPWRYLALKLDGQAEQAAKLYAAKVAPVADQRDWIDHLCAFICDGENEQALLAAITSPAAEAAAAQHCEAYYFIGMRMKLAGQADKATQQFQKALETKAMQLSAYRGAQFALKKFATGT